MKARVRWDRKPCGCVKTNLHNAGRVLIRCQRHRGKPGKKGRELCYFDADGIVRREVEEAA